MFSKSILSVAVITALVSAPVLAQQIIYPAKGQSAKQQKKDEAECYAWAKQQTGYDPVQGTQYVPPPPPPQQQVGGERGQGALRGALGGAAIGAIAGDAGKGAAIGATMGVMAGGAKQRQKEEANRQAAAQHQQAVAQQQQASGQQKQQFQRAYGACFEGRGYTVK